MLPPNNEGSQPGAPAPAPVLAAPAPPAPKSFVAKYWPFAAAAILIAVVYLLLR